jgi:hypothetical protein
VIYPVCKQQEISQQKNHATAVPPLPRGSRTQQLAQDQAQVESPHMDQLPLQNVLVTTQMGAPHTTRVVAMRKAAFHQLAAPPQ